MRGGHTVGLGGVDGGEGVEEKGDGAGVRGAGELEVRAGVEGSGMSTAENTVKGESMKEIDTKPGIEMSPGEGVVQKTKMTSAKILKILPIPKPNMTYQKQIKNQM